MLIFRPVPLLALLKRSFFNCSCLLLLDGSARSSVNLHLIPVFPSLSVFLITQSMTSKTEFGWNTVWAHNPPQGFSVDAVEGFIVVNEANIEACVPFDRLLNDVSQQEDLLNCTPTTSKTCLLFPQLFVNSTRYSLDNYFPHHPCSCRHQGDSSPVATVSQVFFLGQFNHYPLALIWYSLFLPD